MFTHASSLVRVPLTLVMLGACLWLAGCGRTQASRFYLLPGPPLAGAAVAQQEGVTTASVVTVDLASLPEYLDRPQLVTRGPGSILQVHEYDRWAEPLEQNMARALVEHLRRQLPGRTVLSAKDFATGSPKFSVQVDRFDATDGGEVVLQGRWANLVESRGYTEFLLVRPAGGDMAERIKAMDDLLAELAGQLAGQVAAP